MNADAEHDLMNSNFSHLHLLYSHRLLVLCLSMVVMFSTLVNAQSAPDGNKHPKHQAVSDSSDQTTNPFGSPVQPSLSPQQKHAFSSTLDLSVFESVPVFHSGRVKALSTLANETVNTLTGKKQHFDLLIETRSDGSVESIKKISHDPLFTLFDIMIDPLYYMDRPLLGVNYVPLRRKLLTLHSQDTQSTSISLSNQGWLRTGMVSPNMVSTSINEALADHEHSESFRSAVYTLDASNHLFLNSVANLLLVAPDSSDQPWIHLGALPEDAPARVAAKRFAQSWRAGDRQGVEYAAQELVLALESIHPEIQANATPQLEVLYDKLNAFEWGLWIYLGSLLLLILAIGTQRKTLLTTGSVFLLVAIAFHSTGFILRSIIADRFAIQNQFESMTGLSLFASIIGAIMMLWNRQALFGAAAAGTGFFILIAATQSGIPGEHIEREAAILNTSVLLKYHVTTVLTSYGLICLGFITSLFFLGTHYSSMLNSRNPKTQPVQQNTVPSTSDALSRKAKSTTSFQQSLKDLDTATMTILQLAFWTLGVGILLGAWWADHSWGRWWAFDPKETWALVTWIVYLIIIHIRFTTLKNRELITAWLSVAGFVVMIWTYFGVNLLLPGLHAYA